MMEKSWLADNGQLALTHRDGKTEKDCGKTFNISDQGFAYRMVNRTSRHRRSEFSDGVVSSSRLAAQEQALYQRVT